MKWRERHLGYYEVRCTFKRLGQGRAPSPEAAVRRGDVAQHASVPSVLFVRQTKDGHLVVVWVELAGWVAALGARRQPHSDRPAASA